MLHFRALLSPRRDEGRFTPGAAEEQLTESRTTFSRKRSDEKSSFHGNSRTPWHEKSWELPVCKGTTSPELPCSHLQCCWDRCRSCPFPSTATRLCSQPTAATELRELPGWVALLSAARMQSTQCCATENSSIPLKSFSLLPQNDIQKINGTEPRTGWGKLFLMHC